MTGMGKTTTGDDANEEMMRHHQKTGIRMGRRKTMTNDGGTPGMMGEGTGTMTTRRRTTTGRWGRERAQPQ
jgi:hypothetical protein